MVAATATSLPGTLEDDRATVSPFLILMWRCSPVAIRTKAENSSPCEPVHITTNLWSGMFPTVLRSTRTPCGTFKYPRSIAILVFFSIDRPERANLRPVRAQAVTTCWMRSIRLAKLETIILPSALAKISSSALPTTCSLIVNPGFITLVESESRHNTPRLANSASFVKSVGSPNGGVKSIFQSVA